MYGSMYEQIKAKNISPTYREIGMITQPIHVQM